MMEFWVVACLGLMAGALLVLVGAVAITARDVRRTMRRMGDAVPSWERACHEVEHAFGQARRLLTRTGQGVHGVTQTVDHVREAATAVLEDVIAFKERVSHWLGKPLRHGARSGSRRRARRSP